MSLSIGELVGTVSLNDQFSSPMNGLAKAVGLSGESFKALTGFAGLAGTAIVGMTTAVVALGTHGSAVADVQDAFSGLTAAAGSSADVMLGALQQGTLGTISNFELMKMANGTLATGMVKSADDMKTLAAGAKLLADRTGGDTATAFDTLSSAMASGRTTALKQMGVFVDTDAAVQAYANSLGKSVKDLSAHEVATAKSQAVLAALKKQLEANGPATADFADNIDRGKVAVQNFVDDLSVAIAKSPVVAAGMNTMGAALQAAFGGSQKDTVKTLMGFVNDFAIGLTYVGQVGVTAATVFVTAWSAIKTVVLGVITAIALQGTAIVAMVSGLAEMAAKIPGVGKAVEGFAAGAKTLRDELGQVTLSLAAQTAEAAKGVVGNSDLHRTLEGMNGALILTREAMEAAASAQADLSSGAPAVKKGLEDTAGAATLTDAQIKLLTDHAREVGAAMSDMQMEVTARFLELQDEMTRANLTGVEGRLFDIQLARDKELAGLADLQVVWPAAYDAISALVIEKYRMMSDAAQGHFATVQQAAEAAGFKTRDEQQQSADRALELYDRMKASGQFTDGELEKAHKAYTTAVKAMDNEKAMNSLEKFNTIATAASQVLGAIFGKNKAAAIAAVIIDTAAAVISSFKNAGGWPWGLIPAAAMAAIGIAELQKIKSTEAGFAMGTPQMSFQDFGRETTVALHGPEAVVTKHQGSNLADMILGAVTEREDRAAAETRAMREDLRQLHQVMPLWIRDAMQQGAATG